MKRSSGLSFYKRKSGISAGILKEIFSWIFGTAAAVFIALVLNFFWGMSTYVVGESMEPVLYSEQQIFIDRLSYTVSGPRVGDVAVFLPNGNANAHYYVKRIVAEEGDKVLIKDGVLYVNGLESEYVSETITDPGIAENELVLGSGEYFCIGDNSGQSEDSRSADIGPVHKDDFVGKVWFALKGEEGRTGIVK